MTRTSCASFAVAAVLAASAAAGCGGGGGGSGDKGPTKTLKVGQPATVTYKDPVTQKVKSTVEFSPISIEKRSIADLAAIDLEPSQKSSTPYFVKVRYKNVGSGLVKNTYLDLPTLTALDDRGESQSHLIVIGGFNRCDTGSKRLKKGKTFEGCDVYLIPEGGGKLASLEWKEFIPGSGANEKRFVWKP